MARLIDADAFDRRLAAAEFDAALNNADDENRPFREQAMYYSTQSFRDVMQHQPTIDAIPAEWLKELLLSTDDDVDKVELAWITREWQKEQEAR